MIDIVGKERQRERSGGGAVGEERAVDVSIPSAEEHMRRVIQDVGWAE
jgi:hypothetical protein